VGSFNTKISTTGLRRLPGLTKSAPVNRRLYNSLKNTWLRGVGIFALTVVSEMQRAGHIDTGMSASSLLLTADRGDALSEVGSLINPKSGAKVGYTDISGKFVPEGDKSRLTGFRLGRNAFKVLTGSQGRPIFSFNFTIAVWQHFLMDEGKGKGFKKTGPLRSIEKGEQAMRIFVRNSMIQRGLTDIQNWLLTGRVTSTPAFGVVDINTFGIF
jgi:hypothetical protein